MGRVRLLLVGLGNLGRRFCEILADKGAGLRAQYGLDFVVVGAADSRGAAYAPEGLELGEMIRLKLDGRSIAEYPVVGRTGWDARDLVRSADADALLEASPVNLPLGAEPGLTCIRSALARGMNVVTPNKGPLVVAFRELHALAAEHGVQLRYDGTVAGGLPAVYIGTRDLRGADVAAIEAVPNLVTGDIMDLLTDGVGWEEALSRARAEGVLEADASWDLDGWDAAAKLAILANAVLGLSVGLDDIARIGIGALTPGDLSAARQYGLRYRLLAQARREAGGQYALSVAPVALGPEHPLGRLGRKQMGVVYTTDIYGTLTCIIDEPTPVPSSATMLRDLLDIYA